MDIQRLRLNQIERAVTQATAPPRPPSGWIQAIRTALGMTTRQLAARLEVSQSTITSLEKSEAEDRITLQSLRKIADALDCDLQYTLVPRTPLKQRVEERAETVARNRVARVLPRSSQHPERSLRQAPA